MGLMHVKFIDAQTSTCWCSVEVRRGVPAQVSPSPLDNRLKFRGPSPKVMYLKRITLIFTYSPTTRQRRCHPRHSTEVQKHMVRHQQALCCLRLIH
ncbi:hypothetical protein TNCV_2017101 [Trichonephila clavipes]|nr:hypothetical protein TNCV_2017101 [Trichonephila clavipes]